MSASNGRLVIAQISDMHIKVPGSLAYGVVDTAAGLRRCIAFLNGLEPRPDVVVATGDLVDNGTPDEYAHLRELLAPLSIPILVLPGNHDERGALRNAFADHSYLSSSGPLNANVRLGEDVDLLLVDSSVPGKPFGQLEPATLEWLDRELGHNRQKAALVFFHHPPFATGIAHMDRQNLLDSDAFGAVLRRHSRVRLVAAGHVHRPTLTSFRGVPALIAPSPSHAVALDITPDGPPAFRLETPGLVLHVWSPAPQGGELVSHFVSIGDFGPSYPFFDANGDLL